MAFQKIAKRMPKASFRIASSKLCLSWLACRVDRSFLANDDLVAFDRDFVARKRPRWRSSENVAGFRVEVSAVAWADDLLLGTVVVHGAHEMGAALAVGDVFVFGETDENAGLCLWVFKEF